MARINHASLRAQLHHCRAQFEAIKQHGEASADTLALINALFMLVDIVVAVFLERTTPKTSRNSGLPSSRDGTDDGQTHTEGKSGSRSRGPKARHARSDNLRTVTTTHTSAVTGCRQCGHDLTGTACTAHEQRVEIDIVFETVERQVTAEIKTCPRCHTRTKGTFPATMPGPVQYGPGIVAYVVHLLCAQMVSLKRTAAMIQAMTGRLLSEATLLGFVSRLHQALEPWEAAAIDKLLDMPVLHVDETSLRVDRKNYWIHVCAGGPITVKGLHRNRGCEAINTLGIIPRYGGLIVHDCWKAYLTYTQCKHQLCGAHLLRELQAVTDSNAYPWARKMHKLLLIARRQVIQARNSACPCATTSASHDATRRSSSRGARRCPKSRREKRASADRSPSPTPICCLPLCLVGSPRDLAGLFRRRFAWDGGAIREASGRDEVAFVMNDCC